MENENLTTEESDALILEELNITDDNSTTNQEEESSEELEESSQESEEEEIEESSDTQEEETEDEESEDEAPTKKVNKFAKLLSQRNEARKQAESESKEKADAISQVQELQTKLEKLEADWDFWNEEYVNTLVEKKIAERDEVWNFFDEYDDLKPYKKGIMNTMKNENLSLEKATKLYLAEENPELLFSPQTKAKQKSKVLKTPWRASKKLSEWKLTYSDSEFDTMVKKGLITF